MIKTRHPDGSKWSRTVLHVLRDNHPLRWLVAIAVIVIGCKTYYRVIPGEPTVQQIDSLQALQKYFVLHIDKGDFALNGIAIDADRKLLIGTPSALPADHQFYKKTKTGGKSTGYQRAIGDPTQEVHVYASVSSLAEGEPVFIPVANIERIDIYEFDEKATRKTRVYRNIGITLGFILFIVIALSTMTVSALCPEVYVAAGSEYQLAGELYAGAMYAPMERDDYLQLTSLQAVDGMYTVRIASRGTEADHTNLAELTLVEHAPQAKVAFDQTGGSHSIMDARSAAAAINGNGLDLLPALAKQDSAYALFDDDAKPDKSMASIDLRFARPNDRQDGKLLIRGRSTIWQGYVYEKFIEQFGTGYHAYAEAQGGKSASDQYNWLREQGLSMSVFVEKKDGWILQEAISPTGAGADRDIVVPIDLADVQGEVIKLRLSCAFMAWQLDYAAMDFTPDEKMRVITIPPFTARDEKGEDVTHLITATDDRYLVQADSGSVVTVSYLAPPMRGDKAYTAFLHGRGYYTLDRAYTHKPNTSFTRQFERDGQFSKFSKERYADLLEQYSVRTDQSDDAKR